MKRYIDACLVWGLAAIALSAGSTALASVEPLSSHPAVIAVRRGECAEAAKLLNLEVASKDDQTSLFVAGRMLDEGICAQKDPVAATQYFARAADLGDRNAVLDYTTKIGLGEGAEQSYLRAGDLCHKAGLDPQGRLSFYALGYACTVSGVAAKLLRETLPPGAFRPDTGATLVEFNPATSEMRVRATPRVGRSEATTGSMLSHPMVDAPKEIEKAWRDALAQVPKPDTAQLGNQPVELALDVDMTLEAGRHVAKNTVESGFFVPGDLHAIFKTTQ